MRSQAVFCCFLCYGNLCFLYIYFIWICLCVFIQHIIRCQIPYLKIFSCQVFSVYDQIYICSFISAVIHNRKINIPLFIF